MRRESLTDLLRAEPEKLKTRLVREVNLNRFQQRRWTIADKGPTEGQQLAIKEPAVDASM